MQPYEQPSSPNEFEDAYLLPPPVLEERDEFEILKSRARTFWRLEKGFLLAVPLLIFLAIFLNLRLYFRYLDDDIGFLLSFLFRVGTLLSFFASLGLLWTYRRSLPASVASRSPYLSVLLMLIPGFNLYWYYVEFSRGYEDGARALDELEGNRLRFRSESTLGLVTVVLFVLACALFAFCFATDDGGKSGLNSFVDFLIGKRNFYGSDGFGGFLVWLASLALLVGACGLHLTTSSRMLDITVHILEVRQAVEPLATELERAAERARLDATLGAPTSR